MSAVRTGWRIAFGVALAGALVIALAPPGPPGEDWFEQADKLRHLAGFCVLWLFGCQARIGRAWVLALGLLAFGVLIEGLQALTPAREPSVGDVLADAAGLAFGAALASATAAVRGRWQVRHGAKAP